MNILTDKLKWGDLVQLAERDPGLLKDPAKLRKKCADEGGILVRELLIWQTGHPYESHDSTDGKERIGEWGDSSS